LRYVYRHALASGIPLGGLGTGSIEIRVDGKIYDWHIFNNGPWSSRSDDRRAVYMKEDDMFFAIRTCPKGGFPIVRLLRAGSYELGGDPYTLPWVKPVEGIEFVGEPPFALLRYDDPSLHVEVELEAFSPLIPGNVKNSSTPAAIFRFKLRNKGQEEVDVSLLAGIRNPFTALKGVAGVNEVKPGSPTLLVMRGEGVPPRHALEGGSMALTVVGGEVSYSAVVPKRKEALARLWVDLRADGAVSGPHRHVAEEDFYGVLCARLTLRPGEERTITYILTWFFPSHYDELGERLGHAYENWFTSAEDVARYVAERLSGLYEITKKFHDDLYVNGTVDRWLADLVGSQLTTLVKATWFTRDGRFGIWEGYWDPYYMGPGTSAFNTTDVMYYASVMLLFLFPELEVKFLKQHAEWQLSPDCEPYYTAYVLAVPENMYELKKELARDPAATVDFEKLKKLTSRVVAKTGKDPRGRVPHYFGVSLKRPDAYHMVDLMPKFVLMAYRDALWIGWDLLKELWPRMVEALEAVLRLHDTVGLRLPYHQTPAGFDAMFRAVEGLRGLPRRLLEFLVLAAQGEAHLPIGFQTFDVWSFIGVAAYTGILWLAALRAASRAAVRLGDSERAERYERLLKEARENLVKVLWNGEYFDLWYDPVSGLRDKACAAAQLIGQWYASTFTDLGYVVDREKVVSALRAVKKYNFKPDEGLINGAYPEGPRPAFVGDTVYPNGTGIPFRVGSQMDTPWSGVEFAVASHMISEGLVEEGLEVLKAVHERYRLAGHYWNHVEWGAHYMRPMSSWAVIVAVEGLLYDSGARVLRFAPRLRKENFKWILSLPGCWGVVEQRVTGGGQRVLIELHYGSLKLREVVVERLVPSIKEVKARLGERELRVEWVLEDGMVRATLEEEVTLKAGDRFSLELA